MDINEETQKYDLSSQLQQQYDLNGITLLENLHWSFCTYEDFRAVVGMLADVDLLCGIFNELPHLYPCLHTLSFRTAEREYFLLDLILEALSFRLTASRDCAKIIRNVCSMLSKWIRRPDAPDHWSEPILRVFIDRVLRRCVPEVPVTTLDAVKKTPSCYPAGLIYPTLGVIALVLQRHWAKLMQVAEAAAQTASGRGHAVPDMGRARSSWQSLPVAAGVDVVFAAVQVARAALPPVGAAGAAAPGPDTGDATGDTGSNAGGATVAGTSSNADGATTDDASVSDGATLDVTFGRVLQFACTIFTYQARAASMLALPPSAVTSLKKDSPTLLRMAYEVVQTPGVFQVQLQHVPYLKEAADTLASVIEDEFSDHGHSVGAPTGGATAPEPGRAGAAPPALAPSQLVATMRKNAVMQHPKSIATAYTEAITLARAPGQRDALVRAGVAQPIVDGMRMHAGDTRVVIAACEAIRALTLNNTAGQAAFVNAGAVPLLAALLTRHMSTADAVLRISTAVATVAYNNATNQTAFCEAGVIAPLVTALSRYASNSAVLTGLCDALVALAENARPSLRAALLQKGVVRPLVAVLSQHYATDQVAAPGWGLVDALAAPEPATIRNEAQLALASAGIIPVIVTALSRHAVASPETTKRVCDATNAVVCHHRGLQEALVAAGVVPLLVGILSRTVDDLPVYTEVAVLNIVINVSYDQPSHRAAFMAAGIAQLLVAALKRLADHEDAASAACLAIGVVAGEAEPAHAAALADAGAIKPIVATLTRHSARSAVVALAACAAVGYLCARDSNVRIARAFANAGVTPLLATALQQYANHSDQRTPAEILHAIASFVAFVVPHRVMLVNAGVIPYIVTVLSCHPTGVDASHWGSLAVARLALECPSHGAAFVAAGVIPPLVTVLVHHATRSSTVAQSVAFAVSLLAEAGPSAKTALVEAGVMPPLSGALACFGTTLPDVANSVIAALAGLLPRHDGAQHAAIAACMMTTLVTALAFFADNDPSLTVATGVFTILLTGRTPDQVRATRDVGNDLPNELRKRVQRYRGEFASVASALQAVVELRPAGSDLAKQCQGWLDLLKFVEEN
jgi:hypothetical protein